MFGMKRRDSSCCMLLGGRNSARPLAARLRIVVGEIREHANAAHPLGLLRARRERPRGRAAEQRDELATGHRMTAFTICAIASRASRALSAALV